MNILLQLLATGVMNVVTVGARRQKEKAMNPADKPVAATPAITDTKSSRAKARAKNSPVRPHKTTGRAKAASEQASKANTPRRGSKTAKILALLKRPGGASLQQLQKATGWQAHSVRGFLSGTLKKKLGLRIDSAKLNDGQRTYRLSSK
jgi:Protein of unknown function (DUF3489)